MAFGKPLRNSITGIENSRRNSFLLQSADRKFTKTITQLKIGPRLSMKERKSSMDKEWKPV